MGHANYQIRTQWMPRGPQSHVHTAQGRTWLHATSPTHSRTAAWYPFPLQPQVNMVWSNTLPHLLSSSMPTKQTSASMTSSPLSIVQGLTTWVEANVPKKDQRVYLTVSHHAREAHTIPRLMLPTASIQRPLQKRATPPPRPSSRDPQPYLLSRCLGRHHALRLRRRPRSATTPLHLQVCTRRSHWLLLQRELLRDEHSRLQRSRPGKVPHSVSPHT